MIDVEYASERIKEIVEKFLGAKKVENFGVKFSENSGVTNDYFFEIIVDLEGKNF